MFEIFSITTGFDEKEFLFLTGSFVRGSGPPHSSEVLTFTITGGRYSIH